MCSELTRTFPRHAAALLTRPLLPQPLQRKAEVASGAAVRSKGAWTRLRPESHLLTRVGHALTSADVHLVERVLGRRQHPHVRPELLGQRFDHVLSSGSTGHADALCREISSSFILKIKPHHSMELQILKENRTIHVWKNNIPKGSTFYNSYKKKKAIHYF